MFIISSAQWKRFCEVNIIDYINVYELLVLDRNTWNQTDVCKQMIRDKKYIAIYKNATLKIYSRFWSNIYFLYWITHNNLKCR